MLKENLNARATRFKTVSIGRNIFYSLLDLMLYMITAEVIPIAEKSAEAAKALQRVGFQVLSIGEIITIAGEQKLFEQFFRTKLLKLSKVILPGLPKPAKTEFFRPETPPFIPDEVESLIRDVVFPEPPEYFY
jgi:hypothetical protein